MGLLAIQKEWWYNTFVSRKSSSIVQGSCRYDCGTAYERACNSVWLEYPLCMRVVAGSNPATSTMNISKETEAEIFKALEHESALNVGLKFHLDRKYRDKQKIRSSVTYFKNKVKNHPDRYEEYGITDELIRRVEKAVEERNVYNKLENRQLRTIKKGELVDSAQEEKELKELVGDIRDKAFSAINRKLDNIGTNKKKLEAVAFRDLTQLASMTFDKAQLLSGQATENIAVLAKIDNNMNPEEAMEAVLKMREVNTTKNKIRN